MKTSRNFVLLAALLYAWSAGCERQWDADATGPSVEALLVPIIRLSDNTDQHPAIVAQLGTMMMGEARSDAFVLTNNTTLPLSLAGNASCGCTTVEYAKDVAEPGERVEFRLVYNSLAKPDNVGRVRQAFLLTLTPEGDGDPYLFTGVAECYVETSIDVSADNLRFEYPADRARSPFPCDLFSPRTVQVVNLLDEPTRVGLLETDLDGEPTASRVFDVMPAEGFVEARGTLAFHVVPRPDAPPVAHRILKVVSSPEETGQTAEAIGTIHHLPATLVPVRDLVALPGFFQISAASYSGDPRPVGEVVVASWRSRHPVELMEVTASTPVLSAEIVGTDRLVVHFDPSGHKDGMAEESVRVVVRSPREPEGNDKTLEIPVLIVP